MYSLKQYKTNLDCEKNSFAHVREGISEFKLNDKPQLETDTIIAGHDATHPVMSMFLDKLGLVDIDQGSSVNESLVIGLTLSMIPMFKDDFRVMGINSIKDETNRMEFLFRRRVFGNDSPNQEKLSKLLRIFQLSRYLGKILTTENPNLTIKIQEIYKLHRDWYFDSTDDQIFEISCFSDINTDILDSKARLILEKIKNLIDSIK